MGVDVIVVMVKWEHEFLSRGLFSNFESIKKMTLSHYLQVLIIYTFAKMQLHCSDFHCDIESHLSDFDSDITRNKSESFIFADSLRECA